MPETVDPQRQDADVRAWFYLDRWRDIEEWAALRGEARELLGRCLLNTASRFAQLGGELGAVDDSDLYSENDWQWLGLHRRSWRSADLRTASIGLQWYPDKLFARGDENEWPFLAVYVEATDQGQPLRQAISNELAGVRSRLGGRQRGNYLFWRYMQPDDGERAVNPYELVERSLLSFRKLWDLAAPIMDAALAPAAVAQIAPDSDPQSP